MGVKGTNRILPKPRTLRLSNNKMKYVVIDAMPIIYRWCIGSYNTCKYIIDRYGNHMVETFIIFKIAVRFMKDSIIPIFVFDGSKPINKQKLVTKRYTNRCKANDILDNIVTDNDTKQPVFESKEKYNTYIKYVKRSYSINKDNINLAKFLLQWMGLPVVTAPFEADSQCAVIAAIYHNNVLGVVSDDFDPLMYMSTNIIKISSINSNIFEKYTLCDILKNLEQKVNNIIKKNYNLKNKYRTKIKFTHSNLIDIGCLMGTDFCSGIIYNINQNNNKSIDGLLKLYLQCNMNIVDLIAFIKKNNRITTGYINKLLNAINTYKSANIISPHVIDFSFNRPNINMIRYICNDFIEHKSLNDAINIINNTYSNYSNMSINITKKNRINTDNLLNSDIYSLPKPRYLKDIATLSV